GAPRGAAVGGGGGEGGVGGGPRRRAVGSAPRGGSGRPPGRGAAALVLGVAAAAAAPEPRAEPPLDISADNVTGSHGPDGDVVLLKGNLRVTRGRSVLTADDGRYLRAQGMLYLDANVKMVDTPLTLPSHPASYSH